MPIDPASVRPMLATTAAAPLDSDEFVYEPKYDGIRAIAIIEPGRPSAEPGLRTKNPVKHRAYVGRVPRSGPAGPAVHLWSRLGNEKTGQFPEAAAALEQWARGLDRPVVLDGEVVALDERGNPVGFQNLQRIHMHDVAIAFVAFDLLRDGKEDLRDRPLRDRRARLESLLNGVRDPRLRISEQAIGDGRALHARAQAESWEGLIAKRVDSVYTSGKRSPDWRKLKLVRRQACVIGGWTDPRGSRPFFGALLLGVYDERARLQYIGHSGAGFTDAELGHVWKRLRAIETRASPFATTPKTNERPHWVQPKLVAEVKFTEWTVDHKLRHPTYIGMRDDIPASSVRREPDTLIRHSAHDVARAAPKPRGGGGSAEADGSAPPAKESTLNKAAITQLLDQIDAIQESGGDGTLDLPSGDRLAVSNLGKVFWPPRLRSGQAQPLTKGDLFRHYVRVAPYLLPALADRPLVMKRYPNGISGKPFYQHRAPDRIPSGVRVEQVTTGTETRPHLVGGTLPTLLYTVQLASISQDPWFSRVGTPDMIDHIAIDLDPPEGLPFRRVLDVALWVRDELEVLKAPGFPKTSGAGGLHIYVPMPPDTPYGAGLLVAQILATIVARKHPKAATVERAIKARGQRVYVDYLQNILGKTLASAYSARANDFAGVSTPLTWDEVKAGVKPQDFTMRNIADRLQAAGDLWAALRKSKGADLRAVMKYAQR
jgi:bifunctional non-homologous end joining protein LigD